MNDMSTDWTGTVVVGIDGSAYSFRATDWAAAWAAAHNLPLGIIAAYGRPASGHSAGIEDHLRQVAKANADSDLSEARTRVGGRHPKLEVRTQAVDDGAAEALTHAGEQAELVVIGNRGLGPIKEKMLGGVASAVVTYAACSVVTVPHTASGVDGDIVVGMDGSAHAKDAAAFAFEHAAVLGSKVIAVFAWDIDMYYRADLSGTLPMPDLDELQEGMKGSLESWLAPLREKYPNVEVDARVVRAHPATALLEASTSASLIVVGSRGRSGFVRLLLGSTSQDVVRAAETAVAVIR